ELCERWDKQFKQLSGSNASEFEESLTGVTDYLTRDNITDLRSLGNSTSKASFDFDDRFSFIVVKRQSNNTFVKTEKIVLTLNALFSRVGGLCSMYIGLTLTFIMEFIEFIFRLASCDKSNDKTGGNGGDDGGRSEAKSNQSTRNSCRVVEVTSQDNGAPENQSLIGQLAGDTELSDSGSVMLPGSEHRVLPDNRPDFRHDQLSYSVPSQLRSVGAERQTKILRCQEVRLRVDRLSTTKPHLGGEGDGFQPHVRLNPLQNIGTAAPRWELVELEQVDTQLGVHQHVDAHDAEGASCEVPVLQVLLVQRRDVAQNSRDFGVQNVSRPVHLAEASPSVQVGVELVRIPSCGFLELGEQLRLSGLNALIGQMQSQECEVAGLRSTANAARLAPSVDNQRRIDVALKDHVREAHPAVLTTSKEDQEIASNFIGTADLYQLLHLTHVDFKLNSPRRLSQVCSRVLAEFLLKIGIAQAERQRRELFVAKEAAGCGAERLTGCDQPALQQAEPADQQGLAAQLVHRLGKRPHAHSDVLGPNRLPPSPVACTARPISSMYFSLMAEQTSCSLYGLDRIAACWIRGLSGLICKMSLETMPTMAFEMFTSAFVNDSFDSVKKHRVLYPRFNMSEFTEVYSNLSNRVRHCESFGQIILVYKSALVKNQLWYLSTNQPKRRAKEIFEDAMAVNSGYSEVDNAIFIYLGLLRTQIYLKGSPDYLLYGGVGSVIAIGHAFDWNGRHFDGSGQKLSSTIFDGDTEEEYRSRSQCLVTLEEEGANLRPSTRQKLTRFAPALVILLLSVLLLVFILLYALVPKAADQRKLDVCTSKDCISTSAMLDRSVDFTVDPCHDFYSFACGGFFKSHPFTVATIDRGISRFDQNTKTFEGQFFELLYDKNLTKSKDPEIDKLFQAARYFFTTCAAAMRPKSDWASRPELLPKGWNYSSNAITVSSVINRLIKYLDNFTSVEDFMARLVKINSSGFLQLSVNAHARLKMVVKRKRWLPFNSPIAAMLVGNELVTGKQIAPSQHIVDTHQLQIDFATDCAKLTRTLVPAIVYEMFRKTYSDESYTKADEVIANVKQAMLENVRKASWISSTVKKSIEAKIIAISRLHYFPQIPLEEMKKFYGSLNLFEKLQNSKTLADVIWISFEVKYVNKIWFLTTDNPDNAGLVTPHLFDLMDINAFYEFNLNVIYILPGMLFTYVYSNGPYPDYLLYGGLGDTIGHEIGHAFDRDKFEQDFEAHSADPEVTRTLQQYNYRTQCLIDSYNDLIESQAVGFRKGIGNQTASENFSDIVGINAAFRAYKTRESRSGKSGKTPQLLPSRLLSNLTFDQLFFVQSAQFYCFKAGTERIRQLYAADRHSPPRPRYNGLAMHSRDFATVFNCKLGDPMYLSDDRKATRLLLGVLVGLITPVLLVYILLHIRESSSAKSVPAQQPSLCTSEACISASALLQSHVDLSADPSQDFYSFACGGFQKSHPFTAETVNSTVKEDNSIQGILFEMMYFKTLPKPRNEIEAEMFQTLRYIRRETSSYLWAGDINKHNFNITSLAGPLLRYLEDFSGTEDFVVRLAVSGLSGLLQLAEYRKQETMSFKWYYLFRHLQSPLEKFSQLIHLKLTAPINLTLSTVKEINYADAKSRPFGPASVRRLQNLFQADPQITFNWTEFVVALGRQSGNRISLSTNFFIRKMLLFVDVIAKLDSELKARKGPLYDFIRLEAALSVMSLETMPTMVFEMFTSAFVNDSFDSVKSIVSDVKQTMKRSVDEESWIRLPSKMSINKHLSYPRFNMSEFTEVYSNLSNRVRHCESFGQIILVYKSALVKNQLWYLSTNQPKWRAKEIFENAMAVNSRYSEVDNAIFIYLGLLRTQIYLKGSPDYLLYGGVGSVIGHEIGHAFDWNGRHFDGSGRKLSSTIFGGDTEEEYRSRSQCLVSSYDQLISSELGILGKKGNQTVTENFADIVGVNAAFVHTERDAQFHCAKAEKTQRQQFGLDPHTPPRTRVNGRAMHSNGFAKVFSCKPGDAMYLSDDSKCHFCEVNYELGYQGPSNAEAVPFAVDMPQAQVEIRADTLHGFEGEAAAKVAREVGNPKPKPCIGPTERDSETRSKNDSFSSLCLPEVEKWYSNMLVAMSCAMPPPRSLKLQILIRTDSPNNEIDIIVSHCDGDLGQGADLGPVVLNRGAERVLQHLGNDVLNRLDDVGEGRLPVAVDLHRRRQAVLHLAQLGHVSGPAVDEVARAEPGAHDADKVRTLLAQSQMVLAQQADAQPRCQGLVKKLPDQMRIPDHGDNVLVVVEQLTNYAGVLLLLSQVGDGGVVRQDVECPDVQLVHGQDGRIAADDEGQRAEVVDPMGDANWQLLLQVLSRPEHVVLVGGAAGVQQRGRGQTDRVLLGRGVDSGLVVEVTDLVRSRSKLLLPLLPFPLLAAVPAEELRDESRNSLLRKARREFDSLDIDRQRTGDACCWHGTGFARHAVNAECIGSIACVLLRIVQNAHFLSSNKMLQ
uniref:Endothelin-converting enzyme 1 n=1 Tax=Macrostomum lignano TaxID=282301 RepID=A0A1I8H8J2_9PLAT